MSAKANKPQTKGAKQNDSDELKDEHLEEAAGGSSKLEADRKAALKNFGTAVVATGASGASGGTKVK